MACLRQLLAVCAKDAIGPTAICIAAFAGRRDIVETLPADARVDPNPVDRDRQTAPHWAALAGHLDVVRAPAATVCQALFPTRKI